ncbi:MAG: EamA family transporter [Bacteroidota bacterium]
MLVNQQYLGILWCFLGAVLFSVKAIFVKLAYAYEVDSVSLLTLRMLFSLPLFLLMAYFANRERNKQSSLSRTDILKVALIGLFGYYAASLLDFSGLQYISAGLERLILYTYPTLVVLLSAIVYRRRVKAIQLVALICTYIGIFLALSDQSIAIQETKYTWWGVSLVAASALSYAVYVVQSGELVPRIGTFRFTAIAMCTAAVAIILHCGIFHGLAIFHFERPVYGYALAIACISTVLPSLMVSEGIRLVGANTAAIVGGVGPVSTIILAYFFLDETFGNLQILGTASVIIGVLLLSSHRAS